MLSAIVEHIASECFPGKESEAEAKLASLFEGVPPEAEAELRDLTRQIRADLCEPYFAATDPEIFRAKWDSWIEYLLPLFRRFFSVLLKTITATPELVEAGQALVRRQAEDVRAITGEPLAETFSLSHRTALAGDLLAVHRMKDLIPRLIALEPIERLRRERALISFVVANFLVLAAIEKHRQGRSLPEHLRFAVLQAKRAAAVYYCTTDRILRG
jgi:hypothetical protein